MSVGEPRYYDDRGRLRDSKGRFATYDNITPEPDETCPNGCERWGDWWVPVDCAAHLGGAR